MIFKISIWYLYAVHPFLDDLIFVLNLFNLFFSV